MARNFFVAMYVIVVMVILSCPNDKMALADAARVPAAIVVKGSEMGVRIGGVEKRGLVKPWFVRGARPSTSRSDNHGNDPPSRCCS
ncbi:hypothetical protein LINPERPRIM_LOCUS2288 [Linum perenne]